MGKKEHLQLRHPVHYLEVPGWQECPWCHKLKEGLLEHKGSKICRECAKDLDKRDRCRFGNDPNKLERKSGVQIKRCFSKLKASKP